MRRLAMCWCLLLGCAIAPRSDNALDLNQVAAAFSLPDSRGQLVSLDALLGEAAHVVVVFYRGHW